MPASLELTEDGVFVVTCVGDLSFAEYAEVVRELWAHPAFLPIARVLWDFREGSLRWSAKEVRAQARLAEAERPKVEAMVAVLVDSDLSFGLARMVSAYNDETPTTISPFRELDAALLWLGK